MHYKNGRPVKVGDRVIGILNGIPKAGIVIETLPGSTACNMAIVPCPEYVSCSHQSKDFLHAEDVAAADIPDGIHPVKTGDASAEPIRADRDDVRPQLGRRYA